MTINYRNRRPMKANTAVLLSYCMGCGAFASVMMTIQDWLGQEAYIAKMQTEWIDLPTWVGFMCIFINLLGLVYIYTERKCL